MPFVAASPYLYSLFLNNKEAKALNQLNHFNPNFNQKHYIQVNLYGAPSRWGFDDLLTPFDGMPFIPSPGLGNIFKDDLGNLQYKTRKHEKSGFNLPPLWFTNLNVNGKSKQLQEYIDHFIFIRGINPDVAGHPIGGIKTVRPTLDSISIMEELSIHNKGLLPPIMIGNNPATRAFNSANYNGLLVNTKGKGLFKEIFTPFYIQKQKEGLFSKDESLNLINDTLKLLESKKGRDNLYYQNLKKTTELFFDDFDSLYTEFNQTLFKYQTHIQNNLDQLHLPGVTDVSIKAPSRTEVEKEKSPEDKYGRFMVNIGHVLTRDNPNILDGSQINLWSEQFAMTEFLLKKGLGSIFQLSTPVEMGHSLYNCKNIGFHANGSINLNKKNIDIPMDAHFTGTIVNNIATTKFFAGLSTGLMTFIDSLKEMKTTKGHSVFDQSLIHITSEFNRATLDNLSGSDHLGTSSNSTFITGMNKKPHCIGNIRVSSKEYKTTAGEAGDSTTLKRQITPKDIIHTTYNLLGVPSNLLRSAKIIDWKDGEMTPLVEKARNI